MKNLLAFVAFSLLSTVALADPLNDLGLLAKSPSVQSRQQYAEWMVHKRSARRSKSRERRVAKGKTTVHNSYVATAMNAAANFRAGR